MTATLIELSASYAGIIEEIVDNGGDISDEDLAARLNGIAQTFGEKVERCQMAYRKLSADAKAVADFARPYVELAARRESAAQRLKLYVFRCMQVANQIRVETPLGGARLQNSPPSVTVTCDPHDLPIAYTRTVVEPDKAMLLDAWKAKLELPPGVSVEVGKHLRWL